ncbi:Fc.00g024870.m01.CDS01 [Cosmosporella sp. VM-42]
MEVALRRMAKESGILLAHADIRAFSFAAGLYPAFLDTIGGLRKLERHYKLMILSNIDNACMKTMLEGPLSDIKFDGVYMAEDIGSFKPSAANFDYLGNECKRN